MRTIASMRNPIRCFAPVFATLMLAAVVVAGCARSTGPGYRHTPTPWVAPSGTLVPTNNGMPQVRGTQIVDGMGRDLLLRGAMIPTAFAFISRWQRGQDPTQMLDTTTFSTMASWHMNAVRINISYWIYLLNPDLYMARLDQAVASAHAAGLYVILDFHDDKQSGNAGADGVMHSETLTFWSIIAAHFKGDKMMLFDPMNEPKYADWQTWLNGNGSSVVGYQQVISAIRSAGAQQIIVLEPGRGCNCGASAWNGVERFLPSDPNIIFSLHDYAEVVGGNPQAWDAAWGPVLGRYPIYYGEWAVLPHADHPIFCQRLTSANADAVTNAFLNYLQARHANWTAWAFNPSNLVQSFASYEPTSFQTGAPWECEDPSAAQAGMGMDIKDYLAAHAAQP